MKVSIKNPWAFFASFWSVSTGHPYRPRTLCSLFWTGLTGMLALLISLPFSLMGATVSFVVKGWYKFGMHVNFVNAFFGYLAWGLGAVVFDIVVNNGKINAVLWGWIVADVVIALALFVIVFLVGLCVEISDSIGKSGISESTVSKYLKARKSKVCPMIEWDEGKEAAESSN